MANYLDEDQFFIYKDDLLDAFRDSEIVRGYVTERQRRIVSAADMMLQVGYNYYDADQVNKWTAFTLEDYCLGHLPRKLMAGPASFKQMGQDLTVFVRWLHAENHVDNGQELIEMMQGMPTQMAEASKRY